MFGAVGSTAWVILQPSSHLDEGCEAISSLHRKRVSELAWDRGADNHKNYCAISRPYEKRDGVHSVDEAA